MERLGPTGRILMKCGIWIFYENLSRKIQVSLKSDKNNGYFTCRPMYFLTISRSVLLKMRNISNKSCRKNQRTHFAFNNIFFWKSCRLWDNVEEFCRAGQATDDNMAHAHCMLGIPKATKNTLRICNAYCFFHCNNGCTNPLNVTSYIYCMS